MFDISKIIKPNLLSEFSLSDRIAEYKAKIIELLPEWSAAASDPIMKVIKALSMMDILRIQKTNETARQLLLAYATGSNLDNIRPDIERLPENNAIAEIEITFRENASGIIPAGTVFCGKQSNNTWKYKARTFLEYEINPDSQNKQTIEVEVYEDGGDPSGIEITTPMIAIPVIESVEFKEIIVAAGIPEDDERYRQRILLAPTSNMGGRRSYMYYAMSADARIKEVYVETTAPGCLTIWVLPIQEIWEKSDETKQAIRDNLLSKVEYALNAEKNRPCADEVIVEIGDDRSLPGEGIIGNVIRYKLTITPHLLPGTSLEVLNKINGKAKAAVKELYGFGRDISKNIVSGLCYTHGVTGFDITIEQIGDDGGVVADIACGKSDAAYCFESDIVINQPVFDGGID